MRFLIMMMLLAASGAFVLAETSSFTEASVGAAMQAKISDEGSLLDYDDPFTIHYSKKGPDSKTFEMTVRNRSSQPLTLEGLEYASDDDHHRIHLSTSQVSIPADGTGILAIKVSVKGNPASRMLKVPIKASWKNGQLSQNVNIFFKNENPGSGHGNGKGNGQ